jgi:hypothetical protein
MSGKSSDKEDSAKDDIDSWVDDHFQIEKLTGPRNYLFWKMQLETILLTKDLAASMSREEAEKANYSTQKHEQAFG